MTDIIQTRGGDHLIVRRVGRAGRITMNNPKALNALTYEMSLGLEDAMDAWRGDDAVDLIVIDAAGDRAFGAGGDVKELYMRGKAGDSAYAAKFFGDEYRMNAALSTYAKPVVTMVDGIVMGGGVGVSGHGSHRVVSEKTVLAMPECAIGLVPDVGGTWLLARGPGRVGEWLGLTGARVGAADAGARHHPRPARRHRRGLRGHGPGRHRRASGRHRRRLGEIRGQIHPPRLPAVGLVLACAAGARA